MLTSILPGLRDARTPLATGILWGLVVWIVTAEYISSVIHYFSGLLPSNVDLAKIPWSAFAALGLFLAYLLGSMILIPFQAGRTQGLYKGPLAVVLIPLHEILRVLLRTFSFDERWAFSLIRGLRFGAYRDLDAFLSDRLQGGLEVRDARVQHVLAGIPLHLARLRLHRPESYNNFDRQVSEAEFRVNAALPLAALGVLLEVPGGDWSYLIVAGALLLAAQGVANLYAARSQLMYDLIASAAGDDAIAEYVRALFEESM